MSDFFNPVERIKTEVKNFEHLFRGETWDIKPFGFGNEPGTPQDRKKRADQSGQALQTGTDTASPTTPASNLQDELDRRRRTQQANAAGAGTATLLGQ